MSLKSGKTISLITTCMGREEYLAQSLPVWVKLPYIDEIIVVDWSSPGDIQSIIDRNQNGNVIRVLVKNKTEFNLGQARNTGVINSFGYYVLFCDADVILKEKFFEPIVEDFLFVSNVDEKYGLTGTSVCPRFMFNKINGFNEKLNGWGHDDRDFYARIQKYFPIKKVFDLSMASHIEHDSILRTQFYANKDIWKSNQNNIKLCEDICWGPEYAMQSHDVEITPQIPKIIHNIWIGSSTIKQVYNDIAQTWKEHHPSWEYRLWTNSTIASLNLSEQTESILNNPSINIVIKSDLLRYEILYRFGGIYADMDMECLKPFDDMIKTNRFICGIESNRNIIGAALIGCQLSHRAIQDMIIHIQKSLKEKIPSSIEEHLNVCGPEPLSEIFRGNNISPFPKEYFFPVSWNENLNKLSMNYSDAYTKHWWKSMLDGGWTKDYVKHPTYKKLTIVPFIFNWKGQLSKALELESRFEKIFQHKINVINNDNQINYKIRSKWITIPETHFYTKKFFKAIEIFLKGSGDILFIESADASCDNWEGLIDSVQALHDKYKFGVLVPYINYSSWASQTTLNRYENNVVGLKCSDTICWFIHRKVIEEFMHYKNAFDNNNMGWGIDITICAISWFYNLPVLQNRNYIVTHPKSRGYEAGIADKQMRESYSKLPLFIINYKDYAYHGLWKDIRKVNFRWNPL